MDRQRNTRPVAAYNERRMFDGSMPAAPAPSIASEHHRSTPHHSTPPPQRATASIQFNLGRPRFLRRSFWRPLIKPLRSLRFRLALVVIAVVVIASQLIPILQTRLIAHTYALGQGETLLQNKSPNLAAKLKFDSKANAYNYNSDYSVTNQTTDSAGGGPVIKAVIPQDPSKGLQITDPLSTTTITVTPQFQLLDGKQDGNRVVYPLLNGTGWVVYTMQATGVKEDIILRSANGDTMKLKYKLNLKDQGLEAHVQSDGSVGIYGTSSPVGGDVTTGSDKDAALLQKARAKAKKDKLLFSLPAPSVFQSGKIASKTVHTKYQLDGELLTTVTTGLKAAGTTFPLDVDPAVTVIGNSDLFRDTNPDSNIDLNATNGSINRGQVTGGTLPAFATTINSTVNGTLGTARFLAGATAYDGYMYIAGGAGSNSVSNLSSVEYAKIDSTGFVGTWNTTTVLPAATNGLSRFTLLAYNGYLYAIGGSTVNTTCGGSGGSAASAAIYYNRIQTNGQLSSTWSTATPTLPSAACSVGAAFGSGILYVVGGRTGAATTTGIATSAHVAVLPNGNLVSSFTSDPSLSFPVFDTSVWTYNGYIYAAGGYITSAGNLTNATNYTSIKSDGSLNSWSITSLFATNRSNMGSSNMLGYDGYIYLVGGCSAFNGTQSCTTIKNDTQIAQLNADGTAGSYSTDAQATLAETGGSMVQWNGFIYMVGGCSAMNTGTISCASGSTKNTVSGSQVSSAGQIGPLNTSSNTFTTGRYEHASVIVNGYLYVLGGCITVNATNGCQVTASGNANTTSTTYYAQINANGTLGSFTLDSRTGFNSAKGGLAAMGATTYNGYIYLIGGYDYTDGAVSTVYYAQTQAAGGLTATGWQTTSNISGTSGAKYGMSAFVYRGYVYSIGGCSNAANSTGCLTTSYSTTVQRAQIGAAGVLGAWATTGQTQLSAGRALTGLAIYNGYVYLAGGGTQANAGQDQYILYNTLTSSGISGTWTQATGNMTWTDNTTALKLRRTDAYAMNGYLYVTGGHDGEAGGQFGTYGTVQIGKINLSTGNIDSNLQPSVTQITPRWDARTVFSNGYMYVTGGCSTGDPPAKCTVASTLTEYVEIYNAGNKGTSAWDNVATTAYTTNRMGTASVVYNGVLYVAGGCTAYTVGANFGPTTTFCTTPSTGITANVSYTSLNADGSIGGWTSATNSLNAPRAFGCLAAAGGYLYYVGGAANSGTNGTASSTVQYSPLTGSVPGTWVSSSTLLGGGAGSPRKNISCGMFNSHLYITGGEDATATPVYQTGVFYSPDLSSGGDITSWSTGTAFTTARANHVSVVAGGYLYVIGGDTGGTTTVPLQDVQYIQLLPSGGTTGSWSYASDIPQPITGQSAIAANGYIYLFGGRTAPTTCLLNTYVASVNSTGSTSSWSQAVNNFTRARFASAAAFYDGYYYVLGGDDCTNVIGSTATDVVQYGGEQSQAMTAQFSKYADLNGDGDPQKLVIYLTNAQLNSVDIEKWKMTYVSSREAANSWGSSTTINPLVDQNAYNVNAYDGSAVDQVVSRWFYLTFSIDMTTSFTFTDDTQPTITQYGLHYSPPPSKRLLHGRDFRDQTQQGEDLKL